MGRYRAEIAELERPELTSAKTVVAGGRALKDAQTFAHIIMPLADKAHEGRVNPKGIPCLYVATEPWTAIGEVRPTLGARVTMASLVPTRKLQLVNCGSERAAPRFSEEPEAMFREMAVWAYISTAFSEPVTRADDQADYAPTQVLAELFKDMSLDGIAYQSAFGTDGYNVALFNVADAAITGCWVYRVANIKHDVQIEVGAKTWVSDEFTFPKVADFPPVEPSELR